MATARASGLRAVTPMPRPGGALGSIVEELEKTRWAAEVCDSEWNLVYVTSGLREIMGFAEHKELGIGCHVAETRYEWVAGLGDEDKKRWIETNVPYMVQDTPGGKEALRGMVEEHLRHLVDEIEPVPPPRMWASHFAFRQGELPPIRVNYLVTRSYGADGQCAGAMFLYGPSLPTTTLSLVARGDEAMLNQMAALIEPGRRQAAVMFADLQASATLSRRLPTAAYFKLIRAITTAVDAAVAKKGGIVGKHAGDGVSAFFLAENIGSPSAAARAAIEAARAVNAAATKAGEEVVEETGVLELPACAMNIGVHWGGTLYMGQVATGGRLEVTALGDEVNEAARIQETAREGRLLASKTLVEHLNDEDAEALGLDPDSIGYRTLAEMPGATEKAQRDAGSLPVTVLS